MCSLVSKNGGKTNSRDVWNAMKYSSEQNVIFTRDRASPSRTASQDLCEINFLFLFFSADSQVGVSHSYGPTPEQRHHFCFALVWDLNWSRQNWHQGGILSFCASHEVCGEFPTSSIRPGLFTYPEQYAYTENIYMNLNK